MDNLKEMFGAKKNNAEKEAKENAEDVQGKAEVGGKEVKEKADATKQGLETTVDEAKDNIGGNVEAGGKAAKEKAEAVKQGLEEKVDETKDNTKGKVAGAEQDTKETTTGEKAMDTVKNMGRMVSDAAREGMTKASDLAVKMKDKVMDASKDKDPDAK